MSTWDSEEGIEECPNPTPHDGTMYSAPPRRCKYTLHWGRLICFPIWPWETSPQLWQMTPCNLVRSIGR